MSAKFNEAKWQAEDDAMTMARYQEIMQDSKRTLQTDNKQGLFTRLFSIRTRR